MRLTDRLYQLSEEGLKNRRAAQYWRGQACKAKKKGLKWVMRSIGVMPTQRNVYFLLKRLDSVSGMTPGESDMICEDRSSNYGASARRAEVPSYEWIM